MTIQDWGAIGEIVGGIGVIATLVYLAIQIRQNTAIVKMAALQNIIYGGVEHSRAIADNESLAHVLTKGVDDPDSLTSEEQLRFSANAITLYHHLDAAFQMHKSGLLDSESWEKFAYEAPIWLRIPAMRAWFETDKMRLTPSFRGYLEKAIAEDESPDLVPAFGRRIDGVSKKNA